MAPGCADVSAALDKHNFYRTRHQAPSMTWSSTLQASAQAWANTLASEGCGLRHSGAGENLYAASTSGSSITANCTSATTAWYNEVAAYKFTDTPWTDNQPFSKIGHFTQVVWKASVQLGCGAATATTYSGWKCVAIACHYSPPGNLAYDSSFYANVLPPLARVVM
ncbi:hypothetical protein GPECTOR_73g655 [Gonium pectorale]|uniref:SCP domain-containing protein n=1 Tax=Gonium pectorale TaxID=33097 RepID=A0A150G2T8_GONPE|nr:hypothetical protein GPECTOR_73g655 [Gonium pectorale]|eukprot:KXZ44134.1 hypothetical protein GPECTOR_73g655 [Gonium pectorale]